MSSSASMLIPFTGTFTNVSIGCSNGSNVNSITTSPYTFTGLLHNTSYTFTITPYNASGVAGTPSTTSIIATYPTLSSGAVSDLSASAISIPFSGSYSNVTISNGATAVTGITSSPYTFYGLTANTSYTFSIIPYNLLDVSGSTVTTSPLYTWGYVVAGTPSDVSGTTSISIPFTGIFSNVSISNGTNVYSGITTSPYVFSGLGEYVQYTFTITPYNVSSVAGFTSSTIAIYSGVTSSVIAGTPIDVSGTNSEILVPFTGSFSTVSISNNAGNTVTGITSSPYIFTGLIANIFYTFTITPYNSEGIPSVISTTSTICSDAIVIAGSPSIVTGTTSISIPFLGTYTSISITNGAGTTISNVVTSPYVFSGLTANTSYTFDLNAYNQSGRVNNPVYTNSIYTAATVYNNASTLNISSTTIDVSFSGVFTNVSIGNGSTLMTAIVASPYHYTVLSANTAYIFTITPYNSSVVGGSTITTNSVYTLPVVTASTPTDISVNYINVPFAATTTGSFTSVSVSNGTTTINGLTTSPYKFTGLTADTPYTFTITPYGAGGATGTPVNTTSVYTYGQVNAGALSTVSATVISVPFSVSSSDSFTNVSISNGTTTVTGITVSPYLFTGLTANNSYTFTITPYNASGVAGPSAITTSRYTLPVVNAGTPGNVSDTVISVLFTASTIGSFSKVSISNGTRIVPGITTSPYFFTGLTANTSYTFTITPINAADVSGTVATTTSLYTWPFVNGGTITDVSATTLSIPFTASTIGSFTNVSISNGAVSTIGSFTSPYLFGGLIANTAYTFTLTPYNVSSVAGSAVVYASRTTLPYVNVGSPSTSSPTAISVPFSASTVDSFTKVSISNGTLTVPDITTSPYSFTGLVANTSYTFTITPINSLNISGTSVTTTSLYTLPVVNSGTITDVSATTLSIPFTASTAGSFTTVTISNGAGSTITGITTSPYSFGGLIANTAYTFTATPYNASGVAGTAATYGARTTLPYVNVGVPTTSSYSTISIPFSASTVSSFTNVSISNGTLTVLGITTSPYSFTGLTANTSYTFTVTPINALDYSGSVLTTAALYTLGSLTNTYYDGKTTMSAITGDVSGKFNYISWTNQTYTGNTGTVAYNATIGGAIFTDSGAVNALVSNTQYTYSIYPYNSATTPVIGALTTFSAYTLGNVTGAAKRSATTASLTIDVSGKFNNISWTNTTRANTGTGAYSVGIGGTTFTDTGATNSLSANTLYIYSIVPVNASNYNGTAYTSLSAYTLASIAPSASNFYISTLGSSYSGATPATMTLTWAVNATFSYVSVALVTGATSPNLTGGSVGSYATQITSATSYQATSLSYNTYYYLSIIPYNTNNVASTAVTCYAGAYTWAYITTITPLVATAYNAISITFAGSYTTTGISTALVTGVSVPPVVGVTTSPYSYGGLTANTSYTFYFYPVNLNNVWSTSNYQASGAVYTWGSISSATYTSTSSTIIVTVYGLFSSVNWKNNTNGTTGYATGPNSVTFTDSTSLTASTGYTYTLAPMNASGLGPATTNGLSGTTTTGTFTTVAAAQSVAPGLRWTAYSGTTSNNVNFNTSFPIYPISGLSPQGYDPPSNGQSTGLTSILANLSLGTNGNFVGNGSGAGNNHHQFCIEWVGMIYTQSYSGTWTFNTNSDDMSMLWVGPAAVSGWTTANAIVNNSGNHAMTSRSGTISLNANTYYPIRIQYSEAGGGYEMVTLVTPPGGNPFNNGTGFYFTSSNALTQITAVAPLWGAYSAEAWNSGTNVLSDLTGNGRNATTSGVTYTSGSGSGATSSIGYLSGINSSYVNWPTGSIPSTFTIASLTSYNGGGAVSLPTYTSNANGRILQATSGNWLHCHWAGQVGVNHYDGWRTTSTTVSSVSNINNWVIMVGTNNTNIATPNNAIVNGVGVGTVNGGSGNYTLTINGPVGTGYESSYFKFSQLLIWPSGLTTTQMQSVNTILQNYLNNGSSVSIQALLTG